MTKAIFLQRIQYLCAGMIIIGFTNIFFFMMEWYPIMLFMNAAFFVIPMYLSSQAANYEGGK